ncbi:uncharacterized protein EKO05_0003359 [Ascochyta rabiei]|uniref:DUF7726 domain-containing protein n=1 Tax=Didymella rabiei TaxID=5454 RepID=A0A162YDI0_DIDRA|nr:uncharacterized protein EKO05_0003359 [Ascochyta rabiei]KZM19981.1 hypothetical protein ST47_g8859 [Ascochyta rabiei]UPX12823.1 hypothetical protein EKO05_0003359 [Ascochyta rabiei]
MSSETELSAGTPEPEEYTAMDDDGLEAAVDSLDMTDSCDAVRRMIKVYIDNGEMKVGEFRKAIGANSTTYSRFMNQTGPQKGSASSVYRNAWKFFKKRQLLGIKPSKNTQKPKANEHAAAPNVAAIELEGEEDDEVEIYDTCDDIRRKINAHLKKPGVTQAAFLRSIAACFCTTERKIQSAQLSAFRSKKGPRQGNTSAVFYGAYVYFEKLRIAEGKPKSKKRLEMEDIHCMHGGMDRNRPQKYVVAVGSTPYVDEYGRVRVY